MSAAREAELLLEDLDKSMPFIAGKIRAAIAALKDEVGDEWAKRCQAEAENAETDKAFELRKHLDTEQIWELRKRTEQAEARSQLNLNSLHKAEAEVERLKDSRLCKDCNYWAEYPHLLVGTCEAVKRFSSRNYLETPDTFSCRWWAERGPE